MNEKPGTPQDREGIELLGEAAERAMAAENAPAEVERLTGELAAARKETEAMRGLAQEHERQRVAEGKQHYRMLERAEAAEREAVSLREALELLIEESAPFSRWTKVQEGLHPTYGTFQPYSQYHRLEGALAKARAALRGADRDQQEGDV